MVDRVGLQAVQLVDSVINRNEADVVEGVSLTRWQTIQLQAVFGLAVHFRSAKNKIEHQIHTATHYSTV